MGDLSVVLRLGGRVVEERVLPVSAAVRIGEHPRAAMSFPGADLLVVRAGTDLMVRGHRIEPGESLCVKLGAVEVDLEHTLRGRVPLEEPSRFDLRFLVVAIMVTGIGAWLEVSDQWLRSDPLARTLRVQRGTVEEQRLFPVSEEASVQRPGLAPSAPLATLLEADTEVDLAQGPRHVPDDHLSGTAWHTWYLGAVPRDDTREDGLDRLRRNPADALGHRMIAMAAYADEDYEVAASHLRWLVTQHPGEVADVLRLARVERRRGRHAREIELYRAVLAAQPDNAQALQGLVVATARLGRLDEASPMMDELQAQFPDQVGTELAVAMVAAMQGRDREALDALDRVVAGRGSLTQEAQLELRRDLALDPVLADLRKDKRFRALLHRHLGAAAPMPSR